MPYWIESGLEGNGKPEILYDKDGGYMTTGRMYHPEERAHVDSVAPPVGTAGRAYSAHPVDWDSDGDFDLLVGNNKGGLFLRENEGNPKSHAFSVQATALLVGDQPAMIPGGYALPVAADWDGDGKLDIISGNKTGEVWWFRNVGKTGQPALAEPVRLVVDAEAEGLGRGSCSQVDVADWDGDGDLDLLVGDKHQKHADGVWDTHGYVWLYRRSAASKAVDAGAPASGQ